jgi:thioredoxin-dependent peroxiredoxin
MNYIQPISVACVDGSDKTTTLSDLVHDHRYTVLYFYPKDCTSGCTVEAMEFSQLVDEFAVLGAQVV